MTTLDKISESLETPKQTQDMCKNTLKLKSSF